MAFDTEPISSFSVSEPVNSLCFVGDSLNSRLNADEGESSSDDEIEFRSSRIQRSQGIRDGRPVGFSQEVMSGRLVATCHANGEALLWDCAKQSQVGTVAGNRGGPGLAVKRIEGTHSMLYQTRDPNGTVSIHALRESEYSVVQKHETYSGTFVQAAPCHGNPHLLALPSRSEFTVTIVDDRDSVPVTIIPVMNHGMLTSMALSMGGGGAACDPILSCGMESGSVIFHNLSATKPSKSEISLAKDPVLSLDLIPSETGASIGSSVVAVAGMAGDMAEVAELPTSEQGRVALLKATIGENKKWSVRQRARLSTCRVDETSYGKPGVATCRFRSGDGRLFAVGGWDGRVRVFERSRGEAMAIFCGHNGSVNAVDWAPDAVTSGLLVAGSNEHNLLHFWQCLPSTSAV